MKRFVLLTFLIGLVVSAQAGKTPKDTTLFTYGNKKVTTKEFSRGFSKNKHKDSATRASEVDEYLELYKKFRLKVQDAYDLGLDTTEDFKTELATYRKQIAKQFLMDTAVNEKLIVEAYSRMKFELKASHILIFSRPDAAPEDTLKAYKKLLDIRDKIVKDSITFENAALKYSEDPSAGDNSGNLGWFTAFQMIYEFENYAYNTRKGEVSKVFRTEFGYHIVKINDIRKNSGEITIRQIKIELNPSPNSGEIAEAEAKINEVYKKLVAGEKFNILVQQYSEDASTVLKNGELPPFSMTSPRYPENFKNTAFSLTQDGSFSEPIQTATGFHILQRVRLKPLDSLSKIKGTIINKISRDSRQYRNTVAVYDRAKKMYKFKENAKYSTLLKNYIDSSLIYGEFSKDSAKMKKGAKVANTQLFALTKAKKVFTLDSFAKWLQKVQKPSSSKALSGIVSNYYEAYRMQMVMDYYEQDLDNTSEKFAALYKEYKEGILLFTLTDKKVWSKSVEDTVGLKNYYEQNADKYVYKDRYDATIIRCADRTIAENVKKDLEMGITIDSITRKYNKLNPLNVMTPMGGKYEKGANEYADFLFTYGKQNMKYMLVEDPKIPGGFAVIQVHNFMPAGKKTLNEARGSIMSDYQVYLEKLWLDELNKKYPVIVDTNAYNVVKAKLVSKK